VSYYTLTNRYQPPWPHPHYLHKPTTSQTNTKLKNILNKAITSSAYQNKPTNSNASTKFGIKGPLTNHTGNHSLYNTKHKKKNSYPDGNFGINQLLDGSISLSPLYTSPTNDLHVSNATSFQYPFRHLRPAHT